MTASYRRDTLLTRADTADRGTRFHMGGQVEGPGGGDARIAFLQRRMYSAMGRRWGSTIAAAPRRNCTIIGVVEDGQYESLTEDAAPAQFVAWHRTTSVRRRWWCARLCSPSEMARSMVALVHGMDSSLPVTIEPWPSVSGAGDVSGCASHGDYALSTMGLLAALLAMTGVFVRMSGVYTVCQMHASAGNPHGAGRAACAGDEGGAGAAGGSC